MNIGIFFGRSLKIGDIFLDGHQSENPSMPAEVTSSPLEYGANGVDNIVIGPIELQISAFISETPGISLSPQGIFNNFKRTSDALDVLRQAQINRLVMDVYCNTGYYQNMAIANIQPISDLDMVTTIQIDITFQEMIFIGQQNTQNPFDPKYKDQVNRGALQPGDSPV